MNITNEDTIVRNGRPQKHPIAHRLSNSFPDLNQPKGLNMMSPLILCPLLVLSFAAVAGAQNYSIDWSTVDGGGGTSTGGVFRVSGTIGQPDAGKMSGGNFTVDGGFWSLFAIQTPGAPLLSITLTSTNTARVSWPFPSAGFSLQQNASLATTNWTVVPQTVTNNGVFNYIIVNPPAGNRFYRLLKP